MADLLPRQRCRLCVINRARLQRPVVTPTPSRRVPGEGTPASQCMASAGGAVTFRWRLEGYTKRCGRAARSSKSAVCVALPWRKRTSGRRTAPLRHAALAKRARAQRPEMIRCSDAAPSTFEDAPDRQTLAIPPFETQPSPKEGLVPLPRMASRQSSEDDELGPPIGAGWPRTSAKAGGAEQITRCEGDPLFPHLSTQTDLADPRRQNDLRHSTSSRSSAGRPAPAPPASVKGST